MFLINISCVKGLQDALRTRPIVLVLGQQVCGFVVVLGSFQSVSLASSCTGFYSFHYIVFYCIYEPYQRYTESGTFH